MNKRNHIREHNTVTFYIAGVSMTAFMAIVATLTDMGYTVNVTDLHNYDEETNLYSVSFDLNITSRYHAFGVSKDWNRMHKAATVIYSTIKTDLLERCYACGSVSITFFNDGNDELIHHYTVYTVDYKAGTSEGTVRYIRLR